MKTLSFGEIVWDVYDNAAYVGGAPFNFAAHMALHGDEVWMVSALGADEWEPRTREALRRYGVHDEYVTCHGDLPTGTCRVTLDAHAVPTYDLKTNVAYDRIETEAVAGDFDCLYFGTLALRSAHNRRSLERLLEKGAFRYVVADINIRPPFYTAETVHFALSRATMLKISDEDWRQIAPMLGGEALSEPAAVARFLCERFDRLRTVVITCGAAGAFARDAATGEEAACAAEPVTVRSTVGAGDSFAAAFLHEYGKGSGLAAALRHASRVAGLVVSREEAIPPYPDDLLKRSGQNNDTV